MPITSFLFAFIIAVHAEWVLIFISGAAHVAFVHRHRRMIWLQSIAIQQTIKF